MLIREEELYLIRNVELFLFRRMKEDWQSAEIAYNRLREILEKNNLIDRENDIISKTKLSEEK